MLAESKKIVDRQPPRDEKKHLKIAARRAYTHTNQRPLEDKQLTALLPMVHRIAQRTVTYLRPPLSYEDLVSAGTVGLVKAARDFDPSHQAEFKTYAYIRIKGAILDELRGWSFVPPTANKQIRQALQTSVQLTQQSGTIPTDTELAEKLGVTLDKLYRTFENARAQQFVSIDRCADNSTELGKFLAAADTARPDQQLERAELIEQLACAIRRLNERQRQIILLYYHKQLTMKQIAEIFQITEPRVSQLHASALFNLSLKLRHYNDAGK